MGRSGTARVALCPACRSETKVLATVFDPMTGLLSRADFRCALEVPGLQGRGAVLLADIDHFVFVNAVLDHVVGDQMLRSPLERQPLEAIDLALAACSQAKAAGSNRVVGIAPGLEAEGKD